MADAIVRAEFLRFQPFTVVLAAFAGWALLQAYKKERMEACCEEDAGVPLVKAV